MIVTQKAKMGGGKRGVNWMARAQRRTVDPRWQTLPFTGIAQEPQGLHNFFRSFVSSGLTT